MLAQDIIHTNDREKWGWKEQFPSVQYIYGPCKLELR